MNWILLALAVVSCLLLLWLVIRRQPGVTVADLERVTLASQTQLSQATRSSSASCAITDCP